MPHVRQLCWFRLLCRSSSGVAANVRLNVEGLSGELEKNVRAPLSTIQNASVTPARPFLDSVAYSNRAGPEALRLF